MLNTVANVLLMVFGFGLLIFVHELGHFLAARWAGIRAEAFAIGMGPTVCSWRRGIGLRLGSTWPAVERRVREHMRSKGQEGVVGEDGERRRMVYGAMDEMGIGETEYSLRCLPIGGFVKMLGQEDANPNAVSDDPRSYGRCAVGKRMVVVSAGVIMNVLLAVVLFIWAFLVGVDFEAPRLGYVDRSSPAARAVALEAEALGLKEAGLQVDDTVLQIDGEEARTFADVKIATAMARADEPLTLVVRREGVERPLTFVVQPRKHKVERLLGIGVGPAQSTQLEKDPGEVMEKMLASAGLLEHGVKPGMRMVEVNGAVVTALSEVEKKVEESGGRALESTWQAVDDEGALTGERIKAQLKVEPVFDVIGTDADGAPDMGLLSLPMLMQVGHVQEDSANAGVLKAGDVIVSCAGTAYPRYTQLREILKQNKGRSISVEVLRGGSRETLTCKVTSKGRLDFGPEAAENVMICAQPYEVVERGTAFEGEPASEARRSPLAEKSLMAGTRILAVNGEAVGNWGELRGKLIEAAGQNAGEISLEVQMPQEGAPVEAMKFVLAEDEAKAMRELGWRLALGGEAFRPHYVTLTADGNPVKAVMMGLRETKKSILGAYLTLDRLFRGTVGVEQLRGPVGIVHMGATIADRGFMYLVFFMGMISVNLAVINFLPMPIVDGGLFLFLVYEKIKGKQPSLAFQNAATIVGLVLIGTIFVITFYNDVTRLFS